MLSCQITYSAVSHFLPGLQSLASTFPVRSSDRLLQNRISNVDRWTRQEEDEGDSESDAEAEDLAQSSDSAIGKCTAARHIWRLFLHALDVKIKTALIKFLPSLYRLLFLDISSLFWSEKKTLKHIWRISNETEKKVENTEKDISNFRVDLFECFDEGKR